MAYFERTKVTDAAGNIVNPASDDSLTLLRRILLLLKPLAQITGAGSNRLSVDVNNIGTLPTLANVTTVATVSAVTNVTTVASVTASTTVNQTNMGGVTAFELMKAMSRTAYNEGIRSRLS